MKYGVRLESHLSLAVSCPQKVAPVGSSTEVCDYSSEAFTAQIAGLCSLGQSDPNTTSRKESERGQRRKGEKKGGTFFGYKNVAACATKALNDVDVRDDV